MAEKSLELKEKIAIIGTGNYGIAIGKRLLDYGFHVIFGSREPNPSYVKECLNSDSVEVTKISQAFSKSDKFVFLAIAAKNYEKFLNELLNEIRNTSIDDKSKIIIELSNLTDKIDDENMVKSNAEALEEMIKDIFENKHDNLLKGKVNVVKGFNLVNSYTMSTFNYGENKGNVECIPFAGNDIESKNLVIKLAQRLGFQGFDVGPLAQSLKLELTNKKTFVEWIFPCLLTFLFVIFNLVWMFLFYFLFPKKPHTFEKFIKNFSPLAHLNKCLGFSALQILAFVYFASILASLYQLKYNTKYKRFPKYLDFWLKTRKQFGLLAFLLASVHAIASLIITGPSYLQNWYKDIQPNENKFNLTKLTLNGEINMITGFSAYILFVLVALSSINSIAQSLNWSEWRFVQTKLGITCLFVSLLHAIAMYVNIVLSKDNYSTIYLLTRFKLISIYFPAFVLLIRFVFAYFLPISKRLNRIREGLLIKPQQV